VHLPADPCSSVTSGSAFGIWIQWRPSGRRAAAIRGALIRAVVDVDMTSSDMHHCFTAPIRTDCGFVFWGSAGHSTRLGGDVLRGEG